LKIAAYDNFKERRSALQITGTYTVKDIEAVAWAHVRLRRRVANVGLLLITLALFVLGFAFFSSRPVKSGWAVWVLVKATGRTKCVQSSQS
jgi:tryptophan-rich sensory protein